MPASLVEDYYAATEADRVRVQGSAEECGRCDRRRTVRELYSAWLAVPPGVASGEVLAPSVRFRVRLRGA